MSTLEVSPLAPVSGQTSQPVVNDFSIQVATINGSGSQTANTVLMRALFQMGIPFPAKNMFPSNIWPGCLRWFTIRASKQAVRPAAARKWISWWAMNPETAREDVMQLAGGAAVVYDAPLKLKRAAQRSPLLSRAVR